MADNAPVTPPEAREALQHNVVWFRPPEADLGADCVLCTAPAATGITVPRVSEATYDLEVPLCGACAAPLTAPRKWAALCVLSGLFALPALAFLTLLHLAGVDLRANLAALQVPTVLLFLGPFAAAAWLASRNRTLRGVTVADFRPETGEVALRFDNPAVARRVFSLNWPAGEDGGRTAED
jgi:hypothetical protein